MNTPLRFTPIPQPRVWGGTRLAARAPGTPPPVGESWEIVHRPDANSPVANDALKGETLGSLFDRHGEALVGEAFDSANRARFPLILKLIDAGDDLSVQVHPDDRRAARVAGGDTGKTEAWYILRAEPDARIFRGFLPGTTAEDVERAIASGTLAELLMPLPVRVGDCFHVPAGTVHALGKGIVIAEIQQNSDITFRLFDWNRPGMDGRPRELHVAEGLAALSFAEMRPRPEEPEAVDHTDATCERLVACDKFAVERLTRFSGRPARLDTLGLSFHIVFAARGGATVACEGGTASLGEWDSCLVPASAGMYEILAAGEAEVLLFTGGHANSDG